MGPAEIGLAGQTGQARGWRQPINYRSKTMDTRTLDEMRALARRAADAEVAFVARAATLHQRLGSPAGASGPGLHPEHGPAGSHTVEDCKSCSTN